MEYKEHSLLDYYAAQQAGWWNQWFVAMSASGLRRLSGIWQRSATRKEPPHETLSLACPAALCRLFRQIGPKQAETPPKAADPTPPPAAATSGPPSFDTVMKLHDGQTYAEVVAIMGEPKWIAMSSKDYKATTALYWEWPAEYMSIKLSDGLVAYISISGIDVA